MMIHILIYTDIHWYILIYTYIYWHILIYTDVYWYTDGNNDFTDEMEAGDEEDGTDIVDIADEGWMLNKVECWRWLNAEYCW